MCTEKYKCHKGLEKSLCYKGNVSIVKHSMEKVVNLTAVFDDTFSAFNYN